MKKLILAALVLAGLGFYLWARFAGDAWLADFNEERNQAASEQFALGQREGSALDQQACLDGALRQISDCLSTTCAIDAGNYLRGCWVSSQPTAGFCDGVPAFQPEISEDEKTWARHSCWDLNSRGDGCRLLLRQQQQLCTTQLAMPDGGKQ